MNQHPSRRPEPSIIRERSGGTSAWLVPTIILGARAARTSSLLVPLLLSPIAHATHALAQVPTTSTTAVAPPSPMLVQPVLPPLDSVKVMSISKLDEHDVRKGARVTAGLGDIIKLRVRGLQQLVNFTKCLSDTGVPVTNCTEKEISLYLDGREIKGLTPESGAPRPEIGELQYHLQRTPESSEAWADLLGSPPTGPEFFVRPTEVSVGPSSMHSLRTDVSHMQFGLIRLRMKWFIGCSLLLLPVVGVFTLASKKSNLLRDPGPLPASNPKALRPYSLGRTQMAFWFFLVVVAFVYIWLVTGSSESVTGSVLGLMGIGAGTALGAAVIDSTNPATEMTSENFVRDVLTDKNGYSFHRFQMFVWTIVLGVLFVYSVWNRLSMPAFSGTLLALLGISGGTYLGFKLPEHHT
jgi:hypothetical protein